MYVCIYIKYLQQKAECNQFMAIFIFFLYLLLSYVTLHFARNLLVGLCMTQFIWIATVKLIISAVVLTFRIKDLVCPALNLLWVCKWYMQMDRKLIWKMPPIYLLSWFIVHVCTTLVILICIIKIDIWQTTRLM